MFREAQRLQAELDLYCAVHKNKRLKAFTSLPGHCARPFPPRKQERIKAHYRNMCAFCGFNERDHVRRCKGKPKNLSIAYIANHDAGFDMADNGRSFATCFGITNVRNGLPLCHGDAKSCHSQYDAHNLALIPAEMGRPWQILCFNPSDWHVTCHDNLELRKVQVGVKVVEDVVVHQPAYEGFESDTAWRPYRRVLAERLKKTLWEQRKLDHGLISACLGMACLSETLSMHDHEEAQEPRAISSRASVSVGVDWQSEAHPVDEGDPPVMEGNADADAVMLNAASMGLEIEKSQRSKRRRSWSAGMAKRSGLSKEYVQRKFKRVRAAKRDKKKLSQ
eukprot:4306815-Amphidinium_carterae.3